MFFKGNYRGVCVDKHHHTNIEVGKEYFMRGSGCGTHYHVYIKETNQYLGCYANERFEIISELTEEEADIQLSIPVVLKEPKDDSKRSNHDKVVENVIDTNTSEYEETPQEEVKKVPQKDTNTKSVSKPVQRKLF